MSEPIASHNLDGYGHGELGWSRPRDILASQTPQPDLYFFLTTVRRDGFPHTTGIGAAWRSQLERSRAAQVATTA